MNMLGGDSGFDPFCVDEVTENEEENNDFDIFCVQENEKKEDISTFIIPNEEELSDTSSQKSQENKIKEAEEPVLKKEIVEPEITNLKEEITEIKAKPAIDTTYIQELKHQSPTKESKSVNRTQQNRNSPPSPIKIDNHFIKHEYSKAKNIEDRLSTYLDEQLVLISNEFIDEFSYQIENCLSYEKEVNSFVMNLNEEISKLVEDESINIEESSTMYDINDNVNQQFDLSLRVPKVSTKSVDNDVVIPNHSTLVSSFNQFIRVSSETVKELENERNERNEMENSINEEKVDQLKAYENERIALEAYLTRIDDISEFYENRIRAIESRQNIFRAKQLTDFNESNVLAAQELKVRMNQLIHCLNDNPVKEVNHQLANFGPKVQKTRFDISSKIEMINFVGTNLKRMYNNLSMAPNIKKDFSYNENHSNSVMMLRARVHY